MVLIYTQDSIVFSAIDFKSISTFWHCNICHIFNFLDESRSRVEKVHVMFFIYYSASFQWHFAAPLCYDSISLHLFYFSNVIMITMNIHFNTLFSEHPSRSRIQFNHAMFQHQFPRMTCKTNTNNTNFQKGS